MHCKECLLPLKVQAQKSLKLVPKHLYIYKFPQISGGQPRTVSHLSKGNINSNTPQIAIQSIPVPNTLNSKFGYRAVMANL